MSFADIESLFPSDWPGAYQLWSPKICLHFNSVLAPWLPGSLIAAAPAHSFAAFVEEIPAINTYLLPQRGYAAQRRNKVKNYAALPLWKQQNCKLFPSQHQTIRLQMDSFVWVRCLAWPRQQLKVERSKPCGQLFPLNSPPKKYCPGSGKERNSKSESQEWLRS